LIRNTRAAATMIASGNCEHTAPPKLAPKLENAPNSPAFPSRKRFQFVVASVPSSIQNTRRLRLTNASRVRDRLRIDFLRSESPRALIARILVGGILPKTNRFFNDQISLSKL